MYLRLRRRKLPHSPAHSHLSEYHRMAWSLSTENLCVLLQCGLQALCHSNSAVMWMQTMSFHDDLSHIFRPLLDSMPYRNQPLQNRHLSVFFRMRSLRAPVRFLSPVNQIKFLSLSYLLPTFPSNLRLFICGCKSVSLFRILHSQILCILAYFL